MQQYDDATFKAALELIFYRIESAEQNPFYPYDSDTLDQVYADVNNLRRLACEEVAPVCESCAADAGLIDSGAADSIRVANLNAATKEWPYCDNCESSIDSEYAYLVEVR